MGAEKLGLGTVNKAEASPSCVLPRQQLRMQSLASLSDLLACLGFHNVI